MKKYVAERVFSLCLMAIAASAYWQALALPKSRTGLITGPAFFPEWIAVLLFVCSAIPFVKSILRPSEEGEIKIVSSYWILGKLSFFFVLVGATLLAIPYCGWFPAQFLLVFLLELIFEKRKWPQALMIS
ncbi:MAG: tripartite tricarboxylate transporter TctB family protein, partial [Candidatus Latescibacterota bacterium]